LHEAVANGGRNGGQSHGHGQGSGHRCPKVLSTIGCLCPDDEADGSVPQGFDFFPIYPKPAEHEKFKMGALTCSKNLHFLHAARMGYYEQIF
jgi:hypothetical protein